jgi:hypothetical protein
MIPSIEDIIAMLLAGECTKEQAIGWLHTHKELSAGASMRDEFAALAMQTSLQYSQQAVAGHISTSELHSIVARDAYRMADAMLKAREA